MNLKLGHRFENVEKLGRVSFDKRRKNLSSRVRVKAYIGQKLEKY